MRKIFFIVFVAGFWQCSPGKKINKTEDSFSFAFMSDIHLRPEPEVVRSFNKAITLTNQLKPDFVLTGGDLVFDALDVPFGRADSLFRLYKESTKAFTMPVYHVMGNHELFGVYETSGVSPSHPDYKWGMFERYFGPAYYSFDHKGWHFIALNSIDEKDRRYAGRIDEKQVEWIKNDLLKTDPQTPIAIVMHIPFLTTYYQRYIRSATAKSPEGAFVTNRTEVLDLFNKHNLRLVLQGHTHWIEDLNMNNKIRFITGGSVSGDSWKGIKDTERGFMMITIKGKEISWVYREYDK